MAKQRAAERVAAALDSAASSDELIGPDTTQQHATARMA
jgi:hypothetical protein